VCDPFLHSSRQMRRAVRRSLRDPSGRNLRKFLSWYLRCCNAWMVRYAPNLGRDDRSVRYEGKLHFRRETARQFLLDEEERRDLFIACSWPVGGQYVAR
jgi:hypothetical protein